MSPENPLIQVFPVGGEELADRHRKAFDQAVASIEEIPSVAEARATFEQASARLEKLKRAHVAMNARGRELVKAVQSAKQALEVGLVEQFAADGEKPDSARLYAEYSTAQGESAALSRAIARLVEHEIPSGTFAMLEAESALNEERARQLKQIVAERTARTAELLRDASEFEVGLAFDTRSTLSGALQRHADALEFQAIECSRLADEVTRQYHRINGKTTAEAGKGQNQ